MTGVAHFVFFYYIICYTAGFAAYLFAILTALLRGRKEEWAYVLFLTSFLLFFVPSLLNNYLFIVKSQTVGPLDNLLKLMGIAGIGLMVFSLPRFIHAVTRFRRGTFFESVFLIAGAALSVSAVVFLGSPGENAAFYLLCGAPRRAAVMMNGISAVFSSPAGRRRSRS